MDIHWKQEYTGDMEVRKRDGVTYLSYPRLERESAIVHGFSTRLGGVRAVWQLFRLFLVDSQEMSLSFDPRSYLLALAFAGYVVAVLFLPEEKRKACSRSARQRC